MPKVKIFISAQGDPKILNVEGAGASCLEATKNFEKMLGQVKENERVLTEEFFEELPPQELTQDHDG